MSTANRIVWGIAVLGLFMPVAIIMDYVGDLTGMPWGIQAFFGAWIGFSAVVIANRTFRP